VIRNVGCVSDDVAGGGTITGLVAVSVVASEGRGRDDDGTNVIASEKDDS
jgi:hypothetical protein